MTTEQIRHWMQGRDYWHEYVRLNGYAFSPTRDGIAKLARSLDLTRSHIAQRITLFLEN